MPEVRGSKKDQLPMPWKPLPFPLPVVPPRFTPQTAAARNRKLAQQLYAQFFSWPIERSVRILETTPPEVWECEGQRRALHVFHEAAERVPAYKDFLKKHKVNHEKVRTIKDFQTVPIMDKKNYLRRYSLDELCWDGVLSTTQLTSVSSGSTGEPFFWPRGSLLELEITYLFELLLDFFDLRRKPTLFINAFAMGMYVGGPFTLNAMLRIAQKGGIVEIVTPGYALEEILRVTPVLGRQFKQVILASYPPFAKTIIDEGRRRGIDWRRLNVRFLLAGEGFNETWRDYVCELSGRIDPVTDFLDLYGTADAAVLGFETPLSIRLRRVVSQITHGAKEVFGEERLPALLQYMPTLRYFEQSQRELFFTTGSTGIPLVRYDIHDYGGTVPYKEFTGRADANGWARFARGRNWRIPFVYLFGRSDFTAILYGANVYPENIKAALEDRRVRRFFTGRFTMWTETDRFQDQFLLVNIECADGVRPASRLRRDVRKVIVETLLNVNSEYRVVARAIGRKTRPKVRLLPKGDPRYFAGGIKHRWNKKKQSQQLSE